jgi:hypothetical protein
MAKGVGQQLTAAGMRVSLGFIKDHSRNELTQKLSIHNDSKNTKNTASAGLR